MHPSPSVLVFATRLFLAALLSLATAACGGRDRVDDDGIRDVQVDIADASDLDSSLADGDADAAEVSDDLTVDTDSSPDTTSSDTTADAADAADTGCTGASQSLDCLPGPVLSDWDCPERSPTRVIGRDTPWTHNQCAPPLPVDCDAESAQFGWACGHIGAACPDGDFPSDDELAELAPGFEGGAVFVRASADPGEGTRATPYGSIAAALDAVSEVDGAVVVVGPGVYTAPITLTGRVALVGSCVADTTLSVPSEGGVSVTVGPDADALIANLTVRGPSHGIDVQAQSAPTTIRGVRVLDTNAAGGIRFAPGTVGGRLEGVAVRGSGPPPAGDANSISVDVQDGEVTVAGCAFEDTETVAISASNATLTVQDTFIRRTGAGLFFQGPGALTVERVAVYGAQEFGVFGALGRADVRIADVAILDTGEDSEGSPAALELFQQNATLERVVLEGNRGVGLVFVDSQCEGQDIAVFDTDSDSSGQFGYGLDIIASSCELDRLFLAGNRSASVIAFTLPFGITTPTRPTLTNLVVLNTELAACGEIPEGQPGSCVVEGVNRGGGMGVIASENRTEVTLERFAVVGSASAGMVVDRSGSIEARAGQVTDNAIGLNIMVEGFDTSLVEDEVFIYANTTDVARRELVVPDALGPLESLFGSE